MNELLEELRLLRGSLDALNAERPADPLALVKKEELAKRLQVAPRTILNWVELGMPCFPLEKGYRFCPAEVRAWLEERRESAKKGSKAA